MADDPKCTECGHHLSNHDEEPPYSCLYTEGSEPDWEVMCDCEGFSYVGRAEGSK